MLITPRTYSASQIPDRGVSLSSAGNRHIFNSLSGWREEFSDSKRAAEMLLVHQAGSVHLGEVVRYTLTYTPEADSIRPTPEELYVKVKNTSATPLRAAYLHGPYTLYAACYPSTFDPNTKYDCQDNEGIPQFEPYLKAGGNWDAVIRVPQNLCQESQGPTQNDNQDLCGASQSMTWIIEIVSQVVFSSTAAVHFELLVGRDEKSVNLSSPGGQSSNDLPHPTRLHEHWFSKKKGDKVSATRGVHSKSISLVIDDTTSLWNFPPFPPLEEKERINRKPRWNSDHPTVPAGGPEEIDSNYVPPGKKKRGKKVHFVVLTHGLHSNLGADMLYLKESIDAAARNAKVQHKRAKSRNSGSQNADAVNNSAARPDQHGSDDEGDDEGDDGDDSDDDHEQVIVRGFPGNAVRTERGIQYLGKRLAKYILLMTYPDQPYLPLKSSKARFFTRSHSGRKGATGPAVPVPPSASDIHDGLSDSEGNAYRITSISFIGHSLGGLIQMYAIAYIQKHSPQFFELIRPVNFIALASPFLGLSHENPLYVRFALDFGFVGRTGQDLGLSWTAPRVRSGWSAMIGGKGGESQNTHRHADPGSKPLLRILPSGPAHEVLVKFQHRTIYSNVVNDGIVPLRTSCLFFLDWKGLDRVEKARRDNGLVGTMAEWSWAELTGANSKFPQPTRTTGDMAPEDTSDESDNVRKGLSSARVPQRPHESVDDAPSSTAWSNPASGQFLKNTQPLDCRDVTVESTSRDGSLHSPSAGLLNNFLSMFRPKEIKKSASNKQAKVFKRSQTLNTFGNPVETLPTDRSQFSALDRVNSLHGDDGLHAPPKTSLFESAGDLLMPPLPKTEFIVDPASRPRTIFHDRVYHPDDIPPSLPTKQRTLTFGPSRNNYSNPSSSPPSQPSQASNQGWNDSENGLKVEEKIARAYHRDLSWRKVLVRLEPDAHNNIIVRRMFANAYGWPVVKHLVDTHFGYTAAAQSEDTLVQCVERARPPNIGTTGSGDEIEGQTSPPPTVLTSENPSTGYSQGQA